MQIEKTYRSKTKIPEALCSKKIAKPWRIGGESREAL